MNWDILKEGKCPKCEEYMDKKGRIIQCKYCEFKIRESKFDDLVKGKESSAYKKKMKTIKGVQKYNLRASNNKENRKDVNETLAKEKLYNLNKMLAKGEISKVEYESKISTMNNPLVEKKKRSKKMIEVLI